MYRNIVAIVALISIAAGAPANPMQARMADMTSPCVKKCTDDLKDASTSIDFTKSINFGEQFGRVKGMCKNISRARECVDKCGVTFNIYNMKAMRVICDEKTMAELKKHTPCFESESDATDKVCDTRCGGKMSETQAKVKHLLNTTMTTASDISSAMKAAGESCELSKCHARCSRDTIAKLCKESDPTASTFLESYINNIMSAVNDDFKEMGVRGVMKAMMPKQCQFILKPGSFFNDASNEDTESDDDLNDDMFAALMHPPSQPQ